MPNITEFDAGNLAIRPSETGVESFAAAGRRAGAFYNQAGEALARTGAEIGRGVAAAGDVAAEYMAHQELTAGTATGTQLQEKQLEDKDNAIKSIDPQDPLYAHKVEVAVKQWRDQSEQEWQDWASGFNTQKGTDWAQAHIARVRESNFVHSAADIATAAKIGFDNSTHTMVNTASNIAFKDPAQLQTQLDLLDHNTKALVDSSPLKGVDAAKAMTEVNEKAKEGIIKSAIQGAILKGGGWEKIANDPRYAPYVNGAETKMFERAARAQDRSNLANEKAIQLYNKQLAVEDGKKQVSQIVGNGITSDDAGNTTVKPGYFPQLLELAAKNPEAADNARSWFNWGEELNRHAGNAEKIVTDPGVLSSLSARVLDADHPLTDTDTIKAETDAMQGRKGIAHKEGQQLRELIQMSNGVKNDAGFKIAMDGAKEIIQGGMGAVQKPEQAGKFEAFMQQFMAQYLKDGRPANALDLNDENSLIRKMIVPYAAVNSMGPIIRANGGVGAPAAPAPTAPSPAQPAVAKARQVTQNGYTYTLQPDGTYK